VLKSSFVASSSEGHGLLTWKDAQGEQLVHPSPMFYTVGCLPSLRSTHLWD